LTNFNWDDLRVFLSVARNGNAYGAAQALSIDHTTVRRRVRALECALSTKLIDNNGNNRGLTEQGSALFSLSEDIETSILNVSGQISGADNLAVGKVRVGAPDGFGSVFLANALAQIPTIHPGLIVELLTISRQFNVASREADVAIIISFPPPSRHIIRKVGTVNLRLYGSRTYLDRTAPIESNADLDGHNFIGYLEVDSFLPPETVSHPVFQHFLHPSVLSNSIITQFNAVAGGAGIGLFPSYMVKDRPDMVPVLADEVCVPVDMHMLVHADLKNITRYRIVADHITQAIEQQAELFR